MNGPAAAGDLGRAAPRRRVAMAGGLLLLLVAAALGLASMVPGLLPFRLNDDHSQLTTILQQTVDTKGIDAAVAQYRTLRADGFRGVRESESDTNWLGYALLRKDAGSAIRILQLNVETHPQSANVYDSLGEAYLAAGNRPLAIANYEKAIAINPGMKSAISALQTLTDYRRPPYRPLVLFHILAGMLGLVSGVVAISLRKGSRRHGVAGMVFAIAMMTTSAAAAYIAFMDPHGRVMNVFMGTLTFYLVGTSWLTARRRHPRTGLVDWAALMVAVSVAAGLVTVGLQAAASPTGSRDGYSAGLYLVFGAVASLAAALDLRMIRRGGVTGAQRLTRHLWRMCAGLFIAVASFLGQQQLFPVWLRNSGVLIVPPLVILVLLAYWLVRVNGARKTTAAAQQPGIPNAVAG